MDPAVVATLHDAFRDALFDPANAQVWANFDIPLEDRSTAEYRDFIGQRAEYERMKVQQLGLRIE